MSTEDRINALITTWKPRLGIEHWDVRYGKGKPRGVDAQAQTFLQSAERAAEVRVHPKCPKGFEEHMVVHELVHLVLHDYTTGYWELIDAIKDDTASHALKSVRHIAEERAIEMIVRGLLPGASRVPRFAHFYPNMRSFE